MPSEKASADGGQRADRSQRSLAEQLISRTLDPLGVVMLTRERIQETLDDAVKRGRVTRSDANDLAFELLRRGRQQTEELAAEIERVLGGGRDRLEDARRGRLSDGMSRLARTADRARRSVTRADAVAISDYDRLTARQVQARLSELSPAELRQLREYERRHANRKTVLDAVDRLLD
jgi:polyhydroxyalkanoate synthesis regulator phasin